jgi:photosystem II stability/assembly factor-like uncharacterized protein
MKRFNFFLTGLLGCLVLSLSAACSPALPLAGDTATSKTETVTPTSLPLAAPAIQSPALVAIRMFDESNGWGVSDTAILRTVDGARSWHDVSPTSVDSFGYATTTDFIDSLRGWALVSNPADMLSGILYRTSDGGATWDQAAVPFGGGALRFVDGRNGWMMASLGAGAGSMAIGVFQTQDSGATWSQEYINDPTQPGAGDTLPLGGLKNGITPIDALRAWIGGVTYEPGRIYLYQTADGGRTWTVSPVKAPVEYKEAELQTAGPYFVDPEVAFLPVHISYQYGVMLAVYASRDGGASWTLTPQYIPQGGSIDFVSRGVGFAWNGHNFYVTTDGAQSWTSIAPDVDFTDSFAGMDFVSPQVGFVLTDQSDRGRRLYVTRDAGSTWNIVAP